MDEENIYEEFEIATNALCNSDSVGPDIYWL